VSDQEEHEAHEIHEEHLHDHEHAHDHVRDDGHDHDGHAHDHDGHDHDGHDHDQDHALIVDRLPAGLWHVDRGSSEVNFRAKALFGLLPVNGFFDEFSGDLTVEEDGDAHGTLVVQTATLHSGIDRRDADLKSSRYLASDQYPQMTFTLESIQPGGDDHLTLTGKLTIREKTIPLSFPVYAIQHGDHLHIEGRVQVNHDAAGFDWAKPGMVAKAVRTDVALTLISAG
jgi:polyisoprenoid-binding protein YceI